MKHSTIVWASVTTTYPPDRVVAPEAEDVLHQALRAYRLRGTMAGPSNVLALAYGRDGMITASLAGEGDTQREIRLISAEQMSIQSEEGCGEFEGHRGGSCISEC